MNDDSNRVNEHKLDNGMRVLVQPVQGVPIVSVWCWYHVGSKDEVPGCTGVSHWVEHMNFKGTSGISREDLKVWIERAGGTWNGYTWVDQTTYFETLASDSLDLALQIEAERMHLCTYDSDEIESERTVVLAELQGNQDSPEYQLDLAVTDTALRKHPYRWPTIGCRADLESMNRDDLLDHYHAYYIPNNATLVVVGDVNLDSALRAIEDYFAPIHSGPEPARSAVVEATQSHERRVVLERPGTTAYLQVATPAPAVADADFPVLLVADALISGGKGINLWSGGFGRGARMTSPLYNALVDGELAALVSSALLPTEQPYLYTIAATVREGVDPEQVESRLFGVLDQARSVEFSDHALVKAKNQVLTAIAFELEGVTQMAHQLGFFATVADSELPQRIRDRVTEIGASDVLDACSRHWGPEHRTVGWFQPTGS